MAAAIPIIEAVIAAASTAYSLVSTSNASSKAADAQAAALKNQQLDAAAQQAATKNTNLDQLVAQASGNNVSLQDQIKAKIAAGNNQAPGMTQDFWTSTDASGNQTPGFAGMVNDIVSGNSSQQAVA